MPVVLRVRPGDCIASIASERGFFPDTIWNDPANESLRTLRKDPYVLQPDDEVVVPDLRPKQVVCATGKRHTFRRRGVQANPEMAR